MKEEQKWRKAANEELAELYGWQPEKEEIYHPYEGLVDQKGSLTRYPKSICLMPRQMVEDILACGLGLDSEEHYGFNPKSEQDIKRWERHGKKFILASCSHTRKGLRFMWLGKVQLDILERHNPSSYEDVEVFVQGETFAEIGRTLGVPNSLNVVKLGYMQSDEGFIWLLDRSTAPLGIIASQVKRYHMFDLPKRNPEWTPKREEVRKVFNQFDAYLKKRYALFEASNYRKALPLPLVSTTIRMMTNHRHHIKMVDKVNLKSHYLKTNGTKIVSLYECKNGYVIVEGDNVKKVEIKSFGVFSFLKYAKQVYVWRSDENFSTYAEAATLREALENWKDKNPVNWNNLNSLSLKQVENLGVCFSGVKSFIIMRKDLEGFSSFEKIYKELETQTSWNEIAADIKNKKWKLTTKEVNSIKEYYSR